MTNRNRLVRWFITYPKCELTKMAFSRVILQVHACLYLKAVQETHKDGTHHLHVYLVLKNAISHAQFLNFFKKSYPDNWKRIHLKPVRNPKATLQYLDKEDSEPFVVGTLPKPRKRRSLRQMYLDQDITAYEFFRRVCDPRIFPSEFQTAAFQACFPGIPPPPRFTPEDFSKITFS